MKQKRNSAILTLVLGLMFLAFLALTHVVGDQLVISWATPGFIGFTQAIYLTMEAVLTPDFTVFSEIIGFTAVIAVVLVALVFTILWSVRLIIYRRKAANLFSPLLFFLSIFTGVILVVSHDLVELAFEQRSVMVATAYWFVLGVIMVAIALHLLVIGLRSSGALKEASIIPSDIDVDAVEVVAEKVEEENFEEPKEEPVVEEVVEEKVETAIIADEKVVESVPEEAVEAKTAVDLEDPALDALIRKLANEEIDKRQVSKKAVVKEVVEEPKVEVAAVEPVVVPEVETKTAERIPFPKRMQEVEDGVKSDYNELKDYLLSYGLNTRVSNVGDSFRLGRTLYAKVTNSGNTGLKLYLPIEIEDYKDSKIPLKSAAGIKQYEDVPVFIYVRSSLSMKRAKQLIDDVMLKNNISRKYDTQKVDFVSELVK